MSLSQDPTPSLSQNDDTMERILDAAHACFIEFGYRRTTMDTVARRLKLSRMTVYRYFDDKSALFQAVMLRDLQQASHAIEAHLAGLSIEQNPVVEGFALAVTLAREHALVRRLLDTEPEWIVLHMTVEGASMLQFSKAAALAFLRQEKFRHWLKEGDLALAAEIFVRLLVSAILTPGGVMASNDPDELRQVARYLVQPLLRRS